MTPKYLERKVEHVKEVVSQSMQIDTSQKTFFMALLRHPNIDKQDQEELFTLLRTFGIIKTESFYEDFYETISIEKGAVTFVNDVLLN